MRRGGGARRLTLQSVVTEQETVRGEGTDARKKSDEKHCEFFTETERKRTGGEDGRLETALSQKHCYRQSRYKDKG